MTVYDVVPARPHPGLRHFFRRYLGFRFAGYPPGMHRALPSSKLVFLIDLDNPRAFVAGLRTSPVWLHHSGGHHGILLEPTVSRPVHSLTHAVDLGELLGGKAMQLPDQLVSCTSWGRPPLTTLAKKEA
ncbi:MAG: hypothetical protein AAGF12_39510 [Myxococcota bacterium]